MPPKLLLTVGGTGRKPMKTALLSSVHIDDADAGAGAGAGAGAAGAGAAAGADVSSSSVTDVNILDKISRKCSSEELKYLAGLSLLEQKVCFIAQDHLESSFDLERSSGFIAWRKGGGA